MRTTFHLDGLRVVIYPVDHRPAQIHVIGSGSEAAFILNCPHGPPELQESYEFSRSEVGRIKQVLVSDIPLLCDEWRGSMAVTERKFAQAEKRMQALRRTGYAIAARYDQRTSRIIVHLNTGLELAFPPELAEGVSRRFS